MHGEYPHLDTNIGTNGATGTYNTQHFVEFVGDADPLIPKTARESWDTELKSYTDGKDDKAYELVVYPNAVQHDAATLHRRRGHSVVGRLKHKRRRRDGNSGSAIRVDIVRDR